jgi:hypothetical protein
MSRSRISSKTLRDLAPVLLPILTRVAVPMAVRKLRRNADGLGDALGETGARFDKNLKTTKASLEDVRDEAVDSGRKLYDEAVSRGTDLIDLIARKGIEAAEEWAQTFAKPRRRFPWGKILAATAVLGVGVLVLTRD